MTRQLNILSVKVMNEDQLFASAFNQALVKKVNDFYSFTKTKKTSENIKVLQRQSDSIRNELNKAVAYLAIVPSLDRPKAQIALETTGAVFQEVTKNLEIAKISHQKKKPLIQIIDEPVLPLPDDKHKKLIAWILGIILGGIFSVSFFTCKLIYQNIMHNPKYS